MTAPEAGSAEAEKKLLAYLMAEADYALAARWADLTAAKKKSDSEQNYSKKAGERHSSAFFSSLRTDSVN